MYIVLIIIIIIITLLLLLLLLICFDLLGADFGPPGGGLQGVRPRSPCGANHS